VEGWELLGRVRGEDGQERDSGETENDGRVSRVFPLLLMCLVEILDILRVLAAFGSITIAASQMSVADLRSGQRYARGDEPNTSTAG